MEYLNELNQDQKAAVINLNGPMMVIAGAGSGKTRVLTYRIAHLISKGVDPFNILTLTFTNKAAKEMKGRIAKIIGDKEAKNLWMGTFHSVFSRILRREATRLGYTSNFTIYDTADSKNLIKSIIKELGLDDKVYKVGLVYGRISNAKNNLISAPQYLNNTEIRDDDKISGKAKLGEIYKMYVDRCFKANAMDFDDLLFKTNVLLKNFPEVMLKYQEQFKYVLVDEYQDTNYSQYLIVKKLAAQHENLCVVGDDAQSIYAFRGASIKNILNFKKDYPDYKLFKLEQNYRSTKVIVNAANSVIANNKDQIQKEVWTDNPVGEKIKVLNASTDNGEGKAIAEEIADIAMHESASYDEVAILYRTNMQSRSMEEALRKRNIPYIIYGGLSFYQRKEIKDLISYFRLVCNPNDEEAFKRIINYPKRGIGGTTIEKINAAATEHSASLWEVSCNLKQYGVPLNGGTMNKINDFTAIIKSFQARLDVTNAYDLGYDIAKNSGLLHTLYNDKSPEGISRHENIQELLNALKGHTDQKEADNELMLLSDFLLEVALLTDADKDDDLSEKVTLMTIHAAKGLEFPYVFIVGMEENLFPSQLSLNSRADLEEERRLFYVALTRAEKRTTLSYAKSRFRWGNLIYCEPSRFIEEIDERFLEMPIIKEKPTFSTFDDEPNFGGFGSGSGSTSQSTGSSIKKKDPKKTFISSNMVKVDSSKKLPTGDSNVKLEVGNKVEHHRFGKGTVLEVTGRFPDAKASIFFPSSGKKQLLLKFAKLTVLE
ncbi:MAG: DNA helicase-2/ATP-dependent DNA helicase PcrA [Patiriisocius sp.]